MYKSKLQKTMAFIALGTLSSPSLAQESINVGLVEVIPTLNLGLTYDDNIREAETNPQSDTIITITPAVRAQIDNGVAGFALDYSLTKGEYLSESNESFLNQTYGATAGWNIVDTHVVSLTGSIFDAHDARSPDVPSRPGDDELDKYEDTTISLNYSYGQRAVLFGYSLTATVFDKEYKTNREGDDGTRLDDFKSDRLDGRVNFNVSETLQLNLLLGQNKARYSDADSVTLDFDEQYYGVGVNWDVSTTVDLAANYSKVNRELINDSTQDEFKLDQYDLTGTWSPVSYSQVSLGLGQSTSEPNNTGSDGELFILTKTATLSWDHNWTDIFSSNLTVSSSERDFVESSTGRIDDTNTVTLGLGYQLRRWVIMNFNLSNAARDGTETSPKSDKNVAQIGVTLTL